MPVPRTRDRVGRSAGFLRSLVLFCLSPLVLFAPSLGGWTLWLHAHGTFAGHVHLLARSDAHHAAHTGPRDGRIDAGDRDPDPTDDHGLRIEMPPLAVVQTRAATMDFAAALVAPVPSSPVVSENPADCASGRSSIASAERPPPGRAGRSGARRVLRTSHALLI